MTKTMGTLEVAPGVYWVGVKHYNRRLFDSLIPLPYGTSYNAYLVKGSEKSALIDTVNPGFEQDLVDKISVHMDPSKLDFVIMNHAEPDHANAVKHMVDLAPRAKLVTSAKGKEAAMMYFGVDPDRIMVVDETTKIDLGGKTLSFVDAPWLHWPETMFTYLEQDKILFPCDFFGSHLAGAEFYAKDFGPERAVDLAKLYFAEIMMPFRLPGAKAIEKVKKLNPMIIAPSHGVIWDDPKVILEPYSRWTAEKMEKKVAIVYVTMWGSSERMAKALREELIKRGIPVEIFDLPVTDIGHVAKELVDTPVLVVAAPTVLNGVHPSAAYATLLVKTLRAPTKYAAVLTSFGWGGGAVKQISSLIEGTKIEVLGVVEVKGPPKQEEFDKIRELAEKIQEKLSAIQ